MHITTDVPLAPLTTFELGGPARYFTEAAGEADVIEALRWAGARGVPAFILGGGSNLVVADAGYDGLVIRMCQRGAVFNPRGQRVGVEVQAGQPWDTVVAEAVARGLAGVECLSGIPGLAGATPIQNVGAYGQEVSQTIRTVRVLDRATLQVAQWSPDACAFSYRNSIFKQQADRYLVLGVTFDLVPGGRPTVAYRELEEALAGTPAPTLADVRRTVLALRRKKSMVIDPQDPNRRSAGSFFTNPIVATAVAERVVAQAVAAGLVKSAAEVPTFPAGAGLVKLAAGWLVERSGIPKGFRSGAVGVSSAHALALVHHGGGTAAELIALGRHVRAAVQARFGVMLEPEPVLLGVAL